MRLRVASLPIPFRARFEHASAVRECAENVIVIADGRDGHRGLGEGCPRIYVTGETVPTALASITRWRTDGIEALKNLRDIEAWVCAHTDDIDRNPAAFCAVELALLDLFARRAGQSLENHMGVAEPVRGIATSAVYGTGETAKFLKQAALFTLNGMRDAKMKISGDASRDARRASLLSLCGPLRLDANNLWPSTTTACDGLAAVASHAWAVEEPVAARDWPALAEIGARTGLAIILDESVTRLEDLGKVVPGPRYVLNARVSKHGGLLRTLAMIEAARAAGLAIIVGAQVGETSILARAGLVAAKAAGADLIAYEGAFGTKLLSRDATTLSLRFGYGGRITANALGPLGTGLEATPEVEQACA